MLIELGRTEFLGGSELEFQRRILLLEDGIIFLSSPPLFSMNWSWVRACVYAKALDRM